LDKHKLGIIITSLSAAGFGTMAIFGKIAYAHGSNVITLLSIRFILASLFFILLLKIFKVSLKMTKKQIISLIILGALGYGLLSYLFFYGVNLIPASLAGLLLYTYPTIVCLLTYFLKDEEMFPQKIIALLVSAVGLILVLGPAFNSVDIRGVLAILLAAVMYANYIVFSNRVLKEVHWLPSSSIVSMSAAVFFLIIGLFTGEIDLFVPWQVFACGTGIALFSTVLAIGGLYAGISMIGPSKASIVSTVEPVVTVILAFIIFSERLSAAQLVGACLIIISIAYIQVTKKEKNTVEEEIKADYQ
jgi:drug/metabolite transporter (DMT)-like permease